MQMPYATKITASLSGISLGLILSAGEHVGGYTKIILTVVGILWFPISIAVFVHGKQTIELKIESMLGKRSAMDVPKDLTPRAAIWFISTLATAWCLSLWFK